MPHHPGASIEDLGQLLHDAWLDADTMERRGTELRISGYHERSAGGLQRGRFPVELCATNVTSVRFEDDARLGGIEVCTVRSTSPVGGVLVEGCIPATLELLGDDVRCSVTIADLPSETRRPFGRWRRVD